MANIPYNTTNSKQLLQDAVATYAAAHDATTSTVGSLPSATNNILHNSFTGGVYYVRRADLQFDTSFIPVGATITSAVLRMRAVSSGSGNADTDTVVALNATNNGNLTNPVIAEDFDDFGTTSIGSKTLASYTGVDTDVDLTITDLSVINKAGTTRIGLRLQRDIDNNTPTGVNVLRIATNTNCNLIVSYTGANGHSLTTTTAPNAKRTGSNFTSYGASAVTVMAWVKTSTDNTTAMVVDINDGTTETFQIIKVSNTYGFHVRTSSGLGQNNNIPEASVETGSWVHLAGVYDGTGIKVFVNGVAVGSAVAHTGTIITSSPTRLGIGVRSNGADLGFAGQIDDVKVFNTALSAATIASYMSDCSFSPTTSGLTGWWRLDNTDYDDNGNVATNNLVSVGSPSFTAAPAYSCAVGSVPLRMMMGLGS